jgi:hypothetical protein
VLPYNDTYEVSDKHCPFNGGLAIRFPKTLLLRKYFDSFPDPRTLGGAIHEMAHIVLAGDTTSDEDDFIGWEFAFALKYGLEVEWLSHMRSYGITDAVEFGDLKAWQKRYYLEIQKRVATQRGYLISGEPVGIEFRAPGAILEIKGSESKPRGFKQL